MKKHTKNYMKFFGYGEQEIILCTVCGAVAVDLHHIYIKGMGGRKTYERNGNVMDINGVENIISLCRKDHELAHAGNELTRERLYILQEKRILNHG